MVLVLLTLAACESTQPATQAGQALDRAGSAAGQAIGNAAMATGSALDRAGKYVNQKVNPGQGNE